MNRAKKALHSLVVILVVAPLGTGCGSSNGDIVSPPPRWTLTASDEFDGAEDTPPDPTMWTYDIGGDGWGNEQLEFNTDRVENVSHDGEGHLRIVAREESFMGNDYTSGRIKTQGLFEQEHGRFEARIKLPAGQGLWPAFWMLGANIDEVSWPDSGEIDVMEYQGQRPERVFGTLHGPGYSGGASISGDISLPGGETFADDFHVFAVEWDPSLIRFFVDDEQYHSVRSTDYEVPRGKWVFNNEFFMILNLAVGGTLGGPVGPDTVFPAEVLVDYVRIFERPQ
jgi:beta-glucanase (GH16 family)